MQLRKCRPTKPRKKQIILNNLYVSLDSKWKFVDFPRSSFGCTQYNNDITFDCSKESIPSVCLTIRNFTALGFHQILLWVSDPQRRTGRRVLQPWEKRDVCKSLVGKLTKQRLLGKLRKQNYNIKIDVRQIGRNSVNWVELAWFEGTNCRLL